MIEIRPAHYDDVFAVADCLIEARAEIDFEIPVHETPYVYHDLLHQTEAGLLIVADDGGYIAGVIALQICHWPWSRKGLFLNNTQYFVRPEYRRNDTAKKLLDAAKAIADKRGMALRIDLIGGGDREAKDRFIAMQGFKFLGSQFLYEGQG